MPGYRWSAACAERLRTRVTERGYDVGLFREACPQFAAPLGGLTRSLIRSCGVEVARGEGRGPAGEAEATADAVHRLTAQPGWRP